MSRPEKIILAVSINVGVALCMAFFYFGVLEASDGIVLSGGYLGGFWVAGIFLSLNLIITGKRPSINDIKDIKKSYIVVAIISMIVGLVFYVLLYFLSKSVYANLVELTAK